MFYVGNNKKVKMYLGNVPIYRMYLGAERIYPNSGTVTYYVDTNAVYTEDINIDDSCLNPKTFTPTKSGYTFVGWREDTTASSSVLSSKIMDGNDVVLYAVFRQTITLSYNGNNSTGGSTAAQSGTRYYNNGNASNPSFTLRANGFTRKNYTFQKWAMGSTGGTQYSAGANVTLSASTTFYAVWLQTSFPSNGRISIGTLKFTSDTLPGGSTYVQITPSFSGFSGGFTASGNQLRANNAMSVSVSITATSENYYQGENVVAGMTATTGMIQIRKNGSAVFTGNYPNDGRSNNTYHNPKTTTQSGSFSVNAGDVLTFWVATNYGASWYGPTEGVCTLSDISGTINGTI